MFPKLNSRLAFRALAAVVVSLALLLVVFWRVDFDEVGRGIASIDLGAIFLALGFVSLSILVACFRYWNILRTFGQDIGLAATVRANLMGLVGGLLFFQVIGQTLSRWAALRRSGVSPSSVVVTSLYERVLALVILLSAALVAAWLLYDGISVDLKRESLALAKSLLLIGLSVIAVSTFVLRRHLKLLWRSLRRGTNWNAVAIGVALTVFVHGAMLAAYLSLILALAPDLPLTDLAAASVIIMLAASFPISFAGWGVRELGAVFAFGFVGVEAGNALAVSIALGVLSIASVAVLASIVLLLPTRVRQEIRDGPEVVSPSNVDLSRFLFLAIPMGVAGLIMFHVWLPVGEGFVNVNLADPLALMGGILFLLHYKRMDFTKAFPRVFLFIGALSLVLLAGLINGWWRFGYTEWAFVNRGIGWLFILGYIATGGILMVTSPTTGLFRVIRILMWVAIILICADLLLWIVRSYGFRGLLAITPANRIYGESLNPNAFGFQLLLIFAGVLTLVAKAGRRTAFSGFEPVIFGLFFAAIYITQSRTAFITSAFLLVGAFALGFKRWDLLAKGAGVALLLIWIVPNSPLILVVAIDLFNSAIAFLGVPPSASLSGILVDGRMLNAPLSRPGSETERWQSILYALALFREHPIMGAGLGAGIYSSIENGMPLVVIHSTPVWILAEFGLVGGAVVAAFFLSITFWLQRGYQEGGNILAGFGLLIIVIFAVFGLPHDIFYQRLFWFFLGVVLFRGGKLKSQFPRPFTASARVETLCI